MPLHDRKIVDFPSPTPNPSPTSRDPGDGVNRSKVNSFPEQHQHKPTKTFVPGQARFQIFFVRGGGGGGFKVLSLFYSIYKEGGGVQCFFYTFSREGPTFSRGGDPNANFYRNPYNYNLWFSRGPPIPPPLWIRTWAIWNLGTNLCGLLLSLETPNANLSIVFKRLAKALISLRRLV